MTALEELAFAHGNFSKGIVRYLNMLRSSHRSASAATARTTPVTTGLLVFISGAAHGSNLPSTTQATGSTVWDGEKKLACMVREALAKARSRPS